MAYLQRTNDQFTLGLVNLPILFDLNNKPVKVLDIEKNRLKYKTIPDMRYPYFELDSGRGMAIVLRSYSDLHFPVFVHRTMRGYHFLSPIAMSTDDYLKWLKPLIHFNPKCPMVTLRIKPNKWIGETELWQEWQIFDNNATQERIDKTIELKNMVVNQHIGLLQNKYYMVRYRMTGELGNL